MSKLIDFLLVTTCGRWREVRGHNRGRVTSYLLVYVIYYSKIKQQSIMVLWSVSEVYQGPLRRRITSFFGRSQTQGFDFFWGSTSFLLKLVFDFFAVICIKSWVNFWHFFLSGLEFQSMHAVFWSSPNLLSLSLNVVGACPVSAIHCTLATLR